MASTLATPPLPLTLALLLAAACPAPETTGDTDPSTGDERSTGSASTGASTGEALTSTGAASTWTLTGPVRLAEGFVPPQDAIGTLHVALASTCGDWDTTLPEFHTVLTGVDLHADEPTYLFQVPAGTYHLVAFLDEEGGDADATPGPGDLLFTTEGTQECRTYELGAGSGLLDLAVALSAALPFS